MNTTTSPRPSGHWTTEDRCHCGMTFDHGSDHCPCCGCEQFESHCDHVCDGVTCSTEHQHAVCPSCVTDNRRWAGVPTTREEMRSWSMWGCTCTPEASADAMAWRDLVTR